MSFWGQKSWANMMSPGAKLTALECRLPKIVNKAEEFTHLSTKISLTLTQRRLVAWFFPFFVNCLAGKLAKLWRNVGRYRESSGLYFIHITIVNYNSWVIRMTLQVVAYPYPMIIILMTLEVLFTLLENILNTRVTPDDCHMTIVIYF
jgi:hypothetical protein